MKSILFPAPLFVTFQTAPHACQLIHRVHRIHGMLFNVLRLVPKANSDLYSIIESKFPFWLRDKDVLVWYANQSFKVLDYLPCIRRRIFGLLIDKCVEIDVNIFIKDNGDVTIDATENAIDDKEEKFATNFNLNEDKSKSTTSVDILSDKLDALLDRIFQQIMCDCGQDISSTREIYNELFQIFESTILTTHKSKFVQFCIFLPCGLETQIIENNKHCLDNEYGQTSCETTATKQSLDNCIDNKDEAILHRDFVSKLLQILVDPYRATTVRQSCACYLASFVSRASFVGADTVCESISALMRWSEAYIESLGVYAVRATDARRQSDRHSLFYTVCQAAFYIMSFRGNEAIEFYRGATLNKSSNTIETSEGVQNPEDDHYLDVDCINLENKRWVFLCSHALQPLRFCLESVRSEFLHVAHFYGLIDEVILNKLITDAKRLSTGKVNKKAASLISTAATLQRRRQTGGVGGMGRGSNPLKSFFPFDPLLLRQSHEFVEPFYKYWQGPVEEEDILVIDQVGIARDPALDNSEDDESLSQSEDENSDFNNESDDDGNSDIYHSDGVSEKEDYMIRSDMMTPDAYKIRLLQQKAWTETLKRPRSHSMENGSW